LYTQNFLKVNSKFRPANLAEALARKPLQNPMNTAKTILNRTVIIAALGYFVDIYDLVLFSIVRVDSLTAIGVPQEQLLSEGVFILNMQMTGMLLGGILWGVLGDKKGRLSVLYGSIFLYSIANIANAFVTTTAAYGLLRFVAGVGLAGELGAAITLVGECLTKEKRGYGTSIVAGVGVSGAVVAGIVAKHFSWQTAFIFGGILGLLLLVSRLSMRESLMFATVKSRAVHRGAFHRLFLTPKILVRYLSCIFVGVPIWFVIGILVTFSPELAAALGATGKVAAGDAIMYCYTGLIIGDFASGFISQWLGSRKKIIFAFLIITSLLVAVLLTARGYTPGYYTNMCFFLGFGVGYWALFVTVAAEHFGTNIRATVATTVPNFVRGAVVPLTLSFRFLQPSFGLIGSAAIVGGVALALAFLAAALLEETYAKELNYTDAF